jgi:hypothetical protein
MMGNMAQIYSPYFYLPENGPQYLSAMIANVFFCIACIAATVFLRRCLKDENQILREKEANGDLALVGMEGHFRYVL